MEHSVWRLEQQSRALQSRRADARGVWNDQASRTIEQRYLRPQLDADEDLRTQLKVQQTEASTCQSTVDEAHEVGNQAVQASADCAAALAEASRASQTAYLYVEHARSSEVRSVGSINTALSAIDAANSGCGGVPRDPQGPPPRSQVAYVPLAVPSSSSAGGGLQSMGLDEVDVDDLDFSENPIDGGFGRADADHEDYEFAVRTWEEVVRPGIAEGKTLADFEAQDRASGAQPPRSVGEIYRYFTGRDSAIHASRRSDGTLQVIDGRHRIATARSLGISRLPVRID
jgi:hypothetical protein